MTADGFAKKFFRDEAKSNPVFGGVFSKRRDQVEGLAVKLFAAADDVASLNSKAARKAFVKDFLDREAAALGGGIWLQILFAVLAPIFQRLFEQWFQGRA